MQTEFFRQFAILAAMNLNITVPCDVSSHNLVDSCKRFGATYCLSLYMEVGGSAETVATVY